MRRGGGQCVCVLDAAANPALGSELRCRESPVITFATMRPNLDLSTIPVGMLIVLGIGLLLEIVLDVIALVDLYRRPVERVALGNKWIWVAVILLINLIGAILYFAIGRKPAPAVGETAARPARSGPDIADALYGDPDRPKQP